MAPEIHTHRLIHYPETLGLSEATSGEGYVLLESDGPALPFGWLFLFGSRNIWEPGQSVEARGGAAAVRDPTVTPMDIAQVRLGEAASTLGGDALLAPYCAPLTLLQRALEAAGQRGQLRLQSPPGAFGESKKDPAEKRHRFLECVALAENAVYLLGQKNREQARRVLGSLGTFCSFVPTGNPAVDAKELQKRARRMKGRSAPEEIPVRLVAGWPTGGRMTGLFAAEAPAIATRIREAATTPSASKPWWAFWK